MNNPTAMPAEAENKSENIKLLKLLSKPRYPTNKSRRNSKKQTKHNIVG
jgi:hypothetical protein